MAEYELSSGATFAIVFLYILVFLIIIGLAVGLYAVANNEVKIGFTGPAGSIGPTGPTGSHSVGTTLTSSSMMNGNLGAVDGNMMARASCFPCQFYNSQGNIVTEQVIPVGRPAMIRWVVTQNNFTYDNQGTFTLDTGVYSLSNGVLSTSVVYPQVNTMGQMNSSGTYRTISLWIRDVNTSNVVNESELVGTVTVVAIPQTIVSFSSNFQFTVMGQKKISVVTWTDSKMPLEIGMDSRLILTKIS